MKGRTGGLAREKTLMAIRNMAAAHVDKGIFI